MNKIVFMALALSLFSVNAEAGLEKLIQENVQEADKSYQRIISPMEKQRKPSRLWIHALTEGQTNLAGKIFKAVRDTTPGGSPIELKPLQIITFTLQDSQLRYFKKEDEFKASELFEVLRRLIPDLKLKDLSRKYSQVRWIQTGHFELWLSPELVQLKSPE